jgi:hypothetical protein
VDVVNRLRNAKRKNRMKVDWLFKAYAAVAIANFAVFVVIAILLNGDAINGHSAAGHYYLCAHGSCHEVDRATFIYS